MRWTELEKALEPFERKLRAQERFRRALGVREVERPTYERYILGPVQRFDSRKNAFAVMMDGNPFGEEFRETYRRRTGADGFSSPLPQEDLDPEARPAQALAHASWRICREYYPKPLPVAPPEGRYEVDDKARMSRLVKKVGMWLGAEMVRITRVDQRWVYSDRVVPEKYAVLMVVSHDRSLNRSAPSHLSGAAVANTYSRLKFITTQMTDFIRGMGYEAMYRETLGWDPEMLIVPMAIDAGIGEFARTGRVLSPEFGINMRIKAVTTDLPLEVDRPISFGTHEFCMACENCARYCPANAVPFGEPTEAPPSLFNNPGYRKWYIDAGRCLLFWMADRKRWITCGGRCIAVCPWNKPQSPFHHLARWIAIHSPASVKKMLVWGDVQVYGRSRKLKMGGRGSRMHDAGFKSDRETS